MEATLANDSFFGRHGCLSSWVGLDFHRESVQGMMSVSSVPFEFPSSVVCTDGHAAHRRQGEGQGVELGSTRISEGNVW